MSFGIYLTGCVVVIAGLIYGASLMHVPTQWMVVSGLVLVGLEFSWVSKSLVRKTPRPRRREKPVEALSTDIKTWEEQK
jgi:hypothetical protein